MKVKCNLIKADEYTCKNRIYPKHVLENAIKKYNKSEHRFGEILKNNEVYHDKNINNISYVNV